MRVLDAINIVVRGSNKPAIQDLDDQSQSAQIAKRVLTQTRRLILGRGWKFNTREITLQLDTTKGKIPVSSAYLVIKLPEEHLVPQIFTDDKLYVFDEKKQEFSTEEKIEKIVIIMDFEKDVHFPLFPEKLAYFIAHRAAADFYSEAHDGAVGQKLEAEAIRAETEWVSSQPWGDIKDVTGYSRMEAAGMGGSVTTFDPRTQTHH